VVETLLRAAVPVAVTPSTHVPPPLPQQQRHIRLPAAKKRFYAGLNAIQATRSLPLERRTGRFGVKVAAAVTAVPALTTGIEADDEMKMRQLQLLETCQATS